MLVYNMLQNWRLKLGIFFKGYSCLLLLGRKDTTNLGSCWSFQVSCFNEGISALEPLVFPQTLLLFQVLVNQKQNYYRYFHAGQFFYVWLSYCSYSRPCLVHGLSFSIWGTEVVLGIPHLLSLTSEMHQTIFCPGSYCILVRGYSQYVYHIIWLREEMCRQCKFLCPITTSKAFILKLR